MESEAWKKVNLLETERRAQYAIDSQPAPAFVSFIMQRGARRLIRKDGPIAVKWVSVDMLRDCVVFNAMQVLDFCEGVKR